MEDLTDAVITAVDSNLADIDYLARRDVRLVLFTSEGKGVWLALRANGDFEVSDVFPLTASDDVSRWHKEQAYQAVLLGRAVTVDEAEQEAKAADEAKAARNKPKSRSKKTAVAA